MSIGGDLPITHLPWNGYLDPGLPAGHWQGSIQVTGDASGGVAVLTFLFAQGNNSVNERMYNIELMEFRISDDVVQTGIMNIINMGFLLSRSISLPLNPVVPVDVAVSALDHSAFRLPIWLGSQSVPGTPSSIEFNFGNENAPNFRAIVQGYFWEPRSLLAPGGPRRPAEALYGH